MALGAKQLEVVGFAAIGIAVRGGQGHLHHPFGRHYYSIEHHPGSGAAKESAHRRPGQLIEFLPQPGQQLGQPLATKGRLPCSSLVLPSWSKAAGSASIFRLQLLLLRESITIANNLVIAPQSGSYISAWQLHLNLMIASRSNNYTSTFAIYAAHNPRQFTALVTADAMGHTGDDPLKVREGILDLWPIAGDHKFANALVMP